MALEKGEMIADGNADYEYGVQAGKLLK